MDVSAAHKPFFSIIVPVYNVESYLTQCLESLINQTFQDIEIICVNDGSTDRSREILAEFETINNKIIVIDQKNKGLSGARNTGLKHAQGEYVCFLDSDDYYELDACEIIYKYTKHSDVDVIVFGANVLSESQNHDPWYDAVLSPKNRFYYRFTPDILFKEGASRPFVWRNVFRRQFLQNHALLFNETIRYGEDQIFQFEAYPQARTIRFISNKLYNYRHMRAGSLMDSYQQKHFVEHMEIAEIISDFWHDKGYDQTMHDEFLDWIFRFIVHDYVTNIPDENNELLARVVSLLPTDDLEAMIKTQHGYNKYLTYSLMAKTDEKYHRIKKTLYLTNGIRHAFYLIRTQGIVYLIKKITRKVSNKQTR